MAFTLRLVRWRGHEIDLGPVNSVVNGLVDNLIVLFIIGNGAHLGKSLG
ncbi:MAG: hypothetical protein MZV70_01420 [Desulfobacterales bacterium]|nr:hypothetical protein [Desulfobacterales bacterium]